MFGKGDPVLITTWKRVPKGTNGGISLNGTIFSTLGGLVIGIAHYLTVYYFSDSSLWLYAPPQWPIILLGAYAGFFGSLIDSILGATLQYSGMIHFKIIQYLIILQMFIYFYNCRCGQKWQNCIPFKTCCKTYQWNKCS